MAAAAEEGEVEIDAWPLFRKYRDGRIQRFWLSNRVEASPDSGGVKTRDVLVDAATGVSVRIFLPEIRPPENRLPLLLYIHGGAFCCGSTTDGNFHHFLTRLAAAAATLCVSVEYRLAPENRLPAAYDDCFAVLRWLLAGAGREDEWVSGAGDAGRVYVAGESAGGNIVHEVALRARRAVWPADVRFCGAVFLHPFFHDPAFPGKPPQETAGVPYDVMIRSCVPEGEGSGYPPFNPGGPRSPPVAEVVFRRALVAVAEHDFLRAVGERYFGQLGDGGVKAELMLSPGKGHGFFILESRSPDAHADALIQRLVEFFRPSAAACE